MERHRWDPVDTIRTRRPVYVIAFTGAATASVYAAIRASRVVGRRRVAYAALALITACEAIGVLLVRRRRG